MLCCEGTCMVAADRIGRKRKLYDLEQNAFSFVDE